MPMALISNIIALSFQRSVVSFLIKPASLRSALPTPYQASHFRIIAKTPADS
jgi:hypothetical protein